MNVLCAMCEHSVHSVWTYCMLYRNMVHIVTRTSSATVSTPAPVLTSCSSKPQLQVSTKNWVMFLLMCLYLPFKCIRYHVYFLHYTSYNPMPFPIPYAFVRIWSKHCNNTMYTFSMCFVLCMACFSGANQELGFSAQVVWAACGCGLPGVEVDI